MPGPCSCADRYEFLIELLDAIVQNAAVANTNLIKRDLGHVCEITREVEAECGVDLSAVRASTDRLEERNRQLNLLLLVAAGAAEPSQAQIAISAGEMEARTVKERPLAFTSELLDVAQEVKRSAQDALRAAEGALAACSSSVCECGKANVVLRSMVDGTQRAIDNIDVDDLLASALAIPGAATSVAQACGIPNPPDAMQQEIRRRAEVAVQIAPMAGATSRKLKEEAKRLAEEPLPRGKAMEILDLPGVQGGERIRIILGTPGQSPPRAIQARVNLAHVNAELKARSPEERRSQFYAWLATRNSLIRMGLVETCPVPVRLIPAELRKTFKEKPQLLESFGSDMDLADFAAKVGDVAGKTLAGAATGAAIGSAVPGIGTAIGAGVGAGLGAASEAFKQEEPPLKKGEQFPLLPLSVGDSYAEQYGIPVETEGERSVVDVRRDEAFVDEALAQGFTEAQLLSLNVDEHRAVAAALQSGKLTREQLKGLDPVLLGEFARRNPETGEAKARVDTARSGFEEQMRAQGYEKHVDVKQGRQIGFVPETFAGKEVEIKRGPATVKVTWKKVAEVRSCDKEKANFTAAEKAFDEATAASGIETLLADLIRCERDAVERGEVPSKVCGEPKAKVQKAHERLRRNQIVVARAEESLVRCLGKTRARDEFGLPRGSARIGGLHRPVEEDVRQFQTAGVHLLESVTAVEDYLRASRIVCTKREERVARRTAPEATLGEILAL